MAKPGFCWLTPVLCVKDLVASLKHYQEVLGFEQSWKWSEGDAFAEPEHPTFACVCRGECSVFLCQQGQGNPGSWICLNMPSLDALQEIFEEYKTTGADIVEPPEDRSWGMREMIVQDPDGNAFRIGCQLR